jgi:RuvA, C-terminal domain
VRVARLVQRVPAVLEELATGAIHLTGLFLLARVLTPQNADGLLSESRGKTRAEIEKVIATWFPRPDVPPSFQPVAEQPTLAPTVETRRPGTTAPLAHPRLEPLSATRYRLELTAGVSFRDKLELARQLTSHAVPDGDVVEILERGLDALIQRETQRRCGTGRPGKQRPTAPGSRHVPVEVERQVRERDGGQCSFVDGAGRRCSERRFITLEHEQPFALGGPHTVDNLSLLCWAHNQDAARRAFGAEHIENKRAEAAVRKPAPAYDKTLTALVKLGFSKKRAQQALGALETRGAEYEVEPLLREALALLTPGH